MPAGAFLWTFIKYFSAGFQKEFEKKAKGKLDMGKSCIRFKKVEEIPFELLGELTAKMSADEWIECYENAFVKKKK